MRYVFIVLTSLLFFLTGCSPKENVPLRVAMNAWPGYEFLTLAQELGYYKEEGVDVRLVHFQTLADGRRAFEKGQLDIMAGTPMEFYTAREVAGIDPVVFMVADYSNGGDMLLARKEIKSVAALKGKKVAFEVGTVDVLTAANALASGGLGFGDVQVVALPQPNAIKALLAGEVSAVQTYPPFSVEALANPNVVRLFDTSQTPGVIVDILFARRDILDERKEDVARLQRAFFRAVQYHQEHPQDANARMAKRQGLSVADFVDGFSGIKMIGRDEQASFIAQGRLLKNLEQTHAALVKLNLLKGPVCTAACMSSATGGAIPN